MEIDKNNFLEELQFNINGFRRLILIIIMLLFGYSLFSCKSYDRIKKSNELHKRIKHEKKKINF